MELVRQKNVASIITFPIVDADGDFVTGATGLDSEIDAWTDGAAPDGFADCTNEATEIGSTGIYYLSLTQTEMNNDYIVVQVKTTSSGAKTQLILINTMVGDPLNRATTDDGGTINVAAGVVEAAVQSIANNAITANAIASDAITDAKVASDVTIASVTGSVGSIASGGIAAASFAAGAIDAAAIAANAIGASEIANGAIDAATFAAGAIDAAAIADGAIDAATFAAGAINAAATANDFLAEVNAEVVDALNVDTYAEPGQGDPAATASIVTKLGFLYKAWRNKHTQTASEYALYADDGATKDQEAAVSDDTVTFTRNEMQTGA